MTRFTVDDLIKCYERGVFPMADSRTDDSVFLVDPDWRGVLPLDEFHIPKRLARTVRAGVFTVRVDTAFEAVVANCAAERPGRTETWISGAIQDLYGQLFRRGLAHSIECWQDGQLVGGLYGVALGGAFFGESMFSRRTDVSKMALVHLVARLKRGGYILLDTQFITQHLAQFGAKEVARAAYRVLLARAVEADGRFYELGGTGDVLAAGAVLQLTTQTS